MGTGGKLGHFLWRQGDGPLLQTYIVDVWCSFMDMSVSSSSSMLLKGVGKNMMLRENAEPREMHEREHVAATRVSF